MVTFERSKDWEAIRGIVIFDKKSYRAAADDFSPAAMDWQPNTSELIWYVMAKEDGRDFGVWIFLPESAICWQVHVSILPSAWGDKAISAFKDLWEWLWANSPCRRVVASIPIDNRSAISFGKRAGMKEYGVNPMSFMRNGKLVDQVLLGISKEPSCQ